jgi:small conductance mechanosensitive channel
MSGKKGSAGFARSRTPLEFVLIIVVSFATAVLARYLADIGIVPEEYVLPIYAGIALIGGYLVIVVVNRIIARIAEPTLGVTRSRGFQNLFRVVAAIVLIGFVFTIVGVNLTAALVGAGFLGIVLGLAAQQVLGNIFAGFSLLVSKPFDIGDRVTLATSSYGLSGSTYAHENEVSGFTGVIQDIGIFFTRVLMDNGNPAIFPNSVVIGALIVNRSSPSLRNVRVRMDLDKSLDYSKFKVAVLESLRQYDVIDPERSSVEIVDLSTTTFQVVIAVWTKSPEHEPVRTIVIREAMKARDELAGRLSGNL